MSSTSETSGWAKFSRVIFSIFWVPLVGIPSALYNIIVGVASCILIVPIFLGIPKIYFHSIGLFFNPVGKTVELNFEKHPARNILYLLFFGIDTFPALYTYGALLCLMVIFIPLGLQCFKFGKYFIAPFGASVEKDGKIIVASN